jgi:wobble nucleotide-excising tRNase
MEHINLISILFSNEQVKVYEKSFKMEGWDEKMEDYLLSVAKETLDDREKTDLCYGT